jgi:hypothetical protein
MNVGLEDRAMIFVSYAREDEARVRPLMVGLESHGFKVWWDGNLQAGDGFRSSIEDAIDEAALVIVVWTELSIDSYWVRAEATRALEKEKLIPVRMDPVEPPMPFGEVQREDLLDWDGDVGVESFQDLVKSLRARTGPTSLVTVPPPPWHTRFRAILIAVAAALLTLTAVAAVVSNYVVKTQLDKPDGGSRYTVSSGATSGTGNPSSGGAPVKPPDPPQGGKGGAPQAGTGGTSQKPLRCCHPSGSVRYCNKASCAACGYRECDQ